MSRQEGGQSPMSSIEAMRNELSLQQTMLTESFASQVRTVEAQLDSLACLPARIAELEVNVHELSSRVVGAGAGEDGVLAGTDVFGVKGAGTPSPTGVSGRHSGSEAITMLRAEVLGLERRVDELPGVRPPAQDFPLKPSDAELLGVGHATTGEVLGEAGMPSVVEVEALRRKLDQDFRSFAAEEERKLLEAEGRIEERVKTEIQQQLQACDRRISSLGKRLEVVEAYDQRFSSLHERLAVLEAYDQRLSSLDHLLQGHPQAYDQRFSSLDQLLAGLEAAQASDQRVVSLDRRLESLEAAHSKWSLDASRMSSQVTEQSFREMQSRLDEMTQDARHTPSLQVEKDIARMSKELNRQSRKLDIAREAFNEELSRSREAFNEGLCRTREATDQELKILSEAIDALVAKQATQPPREIVGADAG